MQRNCSRTLHQQAQTDDNLIDSSLESFDLVLSNRVFSRMRKRFLTCEKSIYHVREKMKQRGVGVDACLGQIGRFFGEKLQCTRALGVMRDVLYINM